MMPALDPSKPPRTYEKRYVAFLDILGFRNLIAKTATDPDFFNAVASALESIGREAWAASLAAPNVRYYVFSDSIFWTADPTPDGLKILIDGVSRLCESLIYTGVFVRGAVVMGDVYERTQDSDSSPGVFHSPGVVFGPGLIAAYENESKAAKYPRVLVTDDIYVESQAIEYVVRGRAPMFLRERIRKDFDGLYHIDWLCHFHRIYEPGAKGFRTDAPLDFARVKEVVEYWLNESKGNVDIQSKMRWFAGYFNDVLTRGKDVLGRAEDLALIDL